jgi:hypothetical protein
MSELTRRLPPSHPASTCASSSVFFESSLIREHRLHSYILSLQLLSALHRRKQNCAVFTSVPASASIPTIRIHPHSSSPAIARWTSTATTPISIICDRGYPLSPFSGSLPTSLIASISACSETPTLQRAVHRGTAPTRTSLDDDERLACLTTSRCLRIKGRTQDGVFFQESEVQQCMQFFLVSHSSSLAAIYLDLS